ncbi:flagellar export chaperone FlgN [Morganella morganii]|uniref:flagella synthesis protein FlgN n=1 Tax=Morganella morganii TaxID=582 RepID=UPI0021D11FCD|nr:flagellar export chaperone FlgN [Morganella morganii]MCU6237583.1 flagellar export chaperone FlgN [Morganella morganii]
MEKLRHTLLKLQELLNQMDSLLVEEIKQLSSVRINPIALQPISDNKSRILSAINFYDNQRKQLEKQGQFSAPYSNSPKLSNLWSSIVSQTKNANELNQKSYALLELHMQKMQEFKKMVKDLEKKNAMYASSGKTEQENTGQMYNISI